MKHRIQNIATLTTTGILCALPALAQYSLPNPLGTSDPQELVANIISVFLGLVGLLALVIFIYGGVLLMTSGGSEERVKKGRNAIFWAVIGLVLIFASYGIVQAIFGALQGQQAS